jgi:hypothetical protein
MTTATGSSTDVPFISGGSEVLLECRIDLFGSKMAKMIAATPVMRNWGMTAKMLWMPWVRVVCKCVRNRMG